MPTVYRYGGYRFFFYSNEGSERPHIHIQRGEDVAKFWLTPEVERVDSFGMNSHELAKLESVVRSKRTFLERKWHDFFGAAGTR